MCTKKPASKYYFGDEVCPEEENIEENIVLNIIVDEAHIPQNPSPASSLASTKKLEWDSGADIGYINFYNSLKHCRKSRSVPSLNMDLSSISAANKVDVTLNENVLETTVTDCVAPSDSIQMNVDKNPQLHDWVVKDKKDTLKHSTPYVRVDVSKPSTSKISPTKSKDECLQTTLIRICSRGVQTDDELPSSNDKLVECKSLQTEKSMPVNSNSASGSSSSKTGSFKYIRGSDFATTKTSLSSRSTTSSERNVSEKSTTSNVQKSSSSRSTPQSSIINSPLGKIISSQHSNHLIADIDKSLYILQHFIKSKNYNPETKQYYAKKIVSKIIESRYIDDSTSISNTSVNTSNKSSTHNNSEKKLSPKSTETYVSKTSKNTATKSITKSLDNLQTPSIVNETSKNNSCPTSRIDLKNWREEKTLSEKILDEREKILKHRSTGSKSVTPSVKYSDDNDYLIQHSKKERKRQISWINHELSYLQKLKDLLQTKNTGRTSNNFSCHNSENSDSVLRGSGDHNSYHSNSEIEDRFRKIFGSLKHSPSPEDMDKLSKYLTTDQIKYLIDNEAKKLHCPKCECCTNQTQSLKLNINESNNDEDSHTHGESYNSHSHNIYKDLVTPKTASKEAVSAPVLEKQKDVDETILNNNKNDVSIQCTLKKRKKGKEISTATTETTTESISVLEDKNIQTTSSDIIKEPIQTFYENPQDLTVTDSTKCSSESEKIEMLRKMTLKSPKRGKANIEKRRKPHKFLKSSMAYYLTFEEDSQHEMSLDEKSSLERVTVKIPKFKYRRNHVIEEQTRRPDSERSKTLQDYLIKNRPDFLKSTASRKHQFICEQEVQRHNHYLTCKEVKKLTSKQYSKLPEVQNKIKEIKVSNERRYNRCMAYVFSKKLQKKTLQGQISLDTCVQLIPSN